MADPTLVASGATGANATTVSFTLPTVQDGDLLIGWWASAWVSGYTYTNPSQADGNVYDDTGNLDNLHDRLFYGVLAATDSGGTVTCTVSTANKQTVLWQVWRGVDTTTPFNDTPAVNRVNATGTNRTIPSATPTEASIAVTGVLSRGNATLTSWTASGVTRDQQYFNTGSGETNGALGHFAFTAGSIGGGDWVSDVADARAATFLLTLNPASGGGGWTPPAGWTEVTPEDSDASWAGVVFEEYDGANWAAIHLIEAN